MSATRIFSKFKELLDVSWGSVADGNYLKRSGSNIIGAGAVTGPPGPQGVPGVAQVWKGEWNVNVVYSPNDAVSYNGSSFLSTQSNIGSPPVPVVPPALPPLATTASRGTIAALPSANQTQYYARGDNTWQILPQGTYASGPATSVAGNVATYSDTTGRQLASTPPYGVVPVGGVLQVVYREYTANADLSAILPTDDTIPQWNEGTEILVAPITPLFSTSKILAMFDGVFCNNGGPCHGSCALFRDFGTPSAFPNALSAVACVYNANAPHYHTTFGLRYFDAPATTNSTNYRIRVGCNSAPPVGPMRLNGAVSGRYFGGAWRTTLILQEIRQ
jgi:hypothetical protein